MKRRGPVPPWLRLPVVTAEGSLESLMNVGALQAGWFTSLSSDFGLTGAGEAVFGDVAQWEVGDPATDIDGTDLRPTEPGPDVAGADVP
jgi:hypothetical protein